VPASNSRDERSLHRRVHVALERVGTRSEGDGPDRMLDLADVCAPVDAAGPGQVEVMSGGEIVHLDGVRAGRNPRHAPAVGVVDADLLARSRGEDEIGDLRRWRGGRGEAAVEEEAVGRPGLAEAAVEVVRSSGDL
jgi:hypothetical protein